MEILLMVGGSNFTPNLFATKSFAPFFFSGCLAGGFFSTDLAYCAGCLAGGFFSTDFAIYF